MLSVVKIDFIVTTALFVIAYVLSVFVLNLFKGYFISYLGDNSLEITKLKSTNLLDHINLLGVALYIFFKILVIPFVDTNNYVIHCKFRRLYTLVLYFFNFIGAIILATVVLLIGLLVFGNAMQFIVLSLFGFNLANRPVAIIQEIASLLPDYKSFSIMVAIFLGSIVQFNIIVAMWGFVFAILKLIIDYFIDYKIFKDDVWFYIFVVTATVVIMLFFGGFILAGIVGLVFNMAIYLANLI